MNESTPQQHETNTPDSEHQIHTQEPSENYRTKALKKRSLFLFPLSYLGFVVALGLVFGFVYTIAQLVSTGGDPTNSLENDFMSMTYLMLYLDTLGFIIAFMLFKSVRRFTLENMSFEPLKKGMTYVWILIGLGLILGAQYLVFSVLKLETPSNQNQLFGLTSENFTTLKFIAVFVVTALLTPIKEEFLFRGFLLRFFEAKYAKAWLGLFISSTVFGLMHLEYPLAGVTMGLVFGALYLKTKSVMVPIVAHIIWNSYVCLVGLTYLL